MFSYRNVDSFSFFLLILAALSCLPVFSKRASPTQENTLPQLVDDHGLSEIKKIAASYRRCLLDQVFYSKEIWKDIPSAIEACTVGKFWRSLDVHKINTPSLNGNYHFLPPKPITSSCVAVRMNIDLDGQGSGLLPEKTLREMMPQCEFFGSGKEDVNNFRSIGKFYRKITSFTEPPDHMFDINGVRMSVANDPLYPIMVKEKTFLEKYIKLPVIDYLCIQPGTAASIPTKDGTGAYIPNTCFSEFSILQHPINVTVCQFTVKVQLFSIQDNTGVDMMRLGRPQFKPLFISLLSRSPLLPVRGEYIPNEPNGFLNLFYVNMSDPYCAKKFLPFCDDGECHVDDFYED